MNELFSFFLIFLLFHSYKSIDFTNEAGLKINYTDYKNGTKIVSNIKSKVDNALEISSNLIEKFKSLQNGMRNYEQNSQMDETIKILDDMIINELIRILLEALQNNKVANFIKKGAEAMLKEMDNLQKNLKEELKGIGGIE